MATPFLLSVLALVTHLSGYTDGEQHHHHHHAFVALLLQYFKVQVCFRILRAGKLIGIDLQ